MSEVIVIEEHNTQEAQISNVRGYGACQALGVEVQHGDPLTMPSTAGDTAPEAKVSGLIPCAGYPIGIVLYVSFDGQQCKPIYPSLIPLESRG